MSCLESYSERMDTAVAGSAGGEGFHEQLNRDVAALAQRWGWEMTLDVYFLAYLRKMARFGYFTLGPITIDVRLIEDIVERTAEPSETTGMTDDVVRFYRLLVEELRRSGRRRIDELHYLLAYMRLGEGLPGRVFGELGITPEEIEQYLRGGEAIRETANEPFERLMSPEEVAEYLGVHVQTVRAWIRSGHLPARRIAGLRALRVRHVDVVNLLKPLDEAEESAADPSPS